MEFSHVDHAPFLRWILRGKKMREAAFIGWEASRLCSHPQWCKGMFLTARVCEDVKRKKTPPRLVLDAKIGTRVKIAPHTHYWNTLSPTTFLTHYWSATLSYLHWAHLLQLTQSSQTERESGGVLWKLLTWLNLWMGPSSCLYKYCDRVKKSYRHVKKVKRYHRVV